MVRVRAADSVLTYRYLGKLNPGLDAGVERETMPLRHDMRNSTGGIMARASLYRLPGAVVERRRMRPLAPVVMLYEIRTRRTMSGRSSCLET